MVDSFSESSVLLYPVLSFRLLTIFYIDELQSSQGGASRDDSEKEVLDISVKGAIIFVISASLFLVLLYFFMSSWVFWVLIILFCIGGVEVHALFILFFDLYWIYGANIE